MTELPPCPNPECIHSHVIRNGSHHGRARYHCRGCGRYQAAAPSPSMAFYGSTDEFLQAVHDAPYDESMDITDADLC